MLLGPGYLDEIRLQHSVDPLAMIRGQRMAISIERQTQCPDLLLGLTPGQRGRLEEDPVSYAVPRHQMGGAARGLVVALALGALPTPITRRHFAATVALGLSPLILDPATESTLMWPFYSERWDHCASNNLSLRRRHVVAAGAWDEAFTGWGEEDMDFAYRMYLRGLRPVLPIGTSACAFHLDHAVNRVAQRESLLRNARYLISKFPELLAMRYPAYAAWGIAKEDLC